MSCFLLARLRHCPRISKLRLHQRACIRNWPVLIFWHPYLRIGKHCVRYYVSDQAWLHWCFQGGCVISGESNSCQATGGNTRTHVLLDLKLHWGSGPNIPLNTYLVSRTLSACNRRALQHHNVDFPSLYYYTLSLKLPWSYSWNWNFLLSLHWASLLC